MAKKVDVLLYRVGQAPEKIQIDKTLEAVAELIGAEQRKGCGTLRKVKVTCTSCGRSLRGNNRAA